MSVLHFFTMNAGGTSDTSDEGLRVNWFNAAKGIACSIAAQPRQIDWLSITHY